MVIKGRVTANSSQAGDQVIMPPPERRESGKTDTLSVALSNKSRKSLSKREKDTPGTRNRRKTVEASEVSKSLSIRERPKPSEEECLRIQQESKAIIWEQNKSLFIAGKTNDRLFTNVPLTLSSVSYQPQNSCKMYKKITDRVGRINKEHEKRILRLAGRNTTSRTNRTKSSENRMSVNTQLTDSNITGARLLSKSNKGSFRMAHPQASFIKTL